MRKLTKQALETAAHALGGRFFTRAGYRFGVSWIDDLQNFPEGRKIRTALDVGANRGQTAAALAKAFPTACIHSFEPIAETFSELQRATALLPQVQCHRLALAEAPGYLTMKQDADGQNRLVDHSYPGIVERVSVNTIDQFCTESSIDRIDFLKIDVEGAELRVLEGAMQSFAHRSIPMLLIECDFLERENEPHSRFFDLFQFLSPLGYTVVSFYTGGVDLMGWRWGDVLFRRIDQLLCGEVHVSPLQR